ncbi:MAG: NAD-dependent epimerase/dehydratase family protein, partial [Halobaculum sp.]
KVIIGWSIRTHTPVSTVLVTGGSGAIGVPLLQQLQESAHEPVGIDIRNPPLDVDLPIRTADLRSADSLPDADVVVHLAAHSQVQPTITDPGLAVENVALTREVLDYAVDRDASVVIASSREVYGSNIRPEEEDVGVDANNPYAASKLATESLASSYASCYGLDVVTLRLANVYGPYDLNPRVVPIFISKGISGEQLTVFGRRKILDFIHVSDVVDVITQVVTDLPAYDGETLTIGSGRGTRLTDLASNIVRLIDPCPGFTVESNRDGETERFVANVQRATALLDFDPTPLSEGIKRTVEWYRDSDEAVTTVMDKLD